MMTDRINRLRKQSLEAVNRISHERAVLMTGFYEENQGNGWSVPYMRAKAFEHILINKALCVNTGELIVGERGPAPKACPTYPEICLHSLQDLEMLDSRKKVSFKVSEETREIYKNKVIPFWQGRTNRERIMASMDPAWIAAYKAGVFTEFQEQRAPGHTVLGDVIYRKGMLDIIQNVRQRITEIEHSGIPASYSELEELKAMEVAASAIIAFASRYADELERIASLELQPDSWAGKEEILELAGICRRVPAHAPVTFHEALQYYWFVHLGVITELNPWDSFNPGRLDQHLYPFYVKGIADGSLSKERAVEILHSFWIKFNNHPAPPKVGVTALESNTYTDFCLINLGGVKADGTDAVNELTFVLLDVIEEMRLLQPSSMVQVSACNPDEFIRRTLRITKTGFGQPSFFNTDVIIEELVRQGKDITDARNGGASGCVESGAFGTEAYILSGYFNLPKVLELTLNNGFDKRTQTQVGIKTGIPEHFATFYDLMNAFGKQLEYLISVKIQGNNRIHRVFAEHMPVPFLSLLINDCIRNGKDYNAGGARYNTTYIQGVGLGSITDSLTSLRYHVFEKGTVSMKGMLDALSRNFEDYGEFRMELVYRTPKYGNDEDYSDLQAKAVFELFFEAVDSKPTSIGGVHRINLLPTTSHVYFGSVIGALPDGRKAGEPLSEGISPVQGADLKGPTAVLRSAASIDHTRTGGTLLNQKFSPSFFEGDESIGNLTALIRSYFRMKGHHIQFNVVSADTLKDAQKHPEKYRDLIVRVAGYSDYFNDLGEDLQNEIIRRTEHGAL
jgi:formate C-acetyltransferase